MSDNCRRNPVAVLFRKTKSVYSIHRQCSKFVREKNDQVTYTLRSGNKKILFSFLLLSLLKIFNALSSSRLLFHWDDFAFSPLRRLNILSGLFLSFFLLEYPLPASFLCRREFEKRRKKGQKTISNTGIACKLVAKTTEKKPPLQMSSVSSERNPNARTKKTNPLKQLDWIGRSQNPYDDDPPAPQRNQFHHKDIWV